MCSFSWNRFRNRAVQVGAKAQPCTSGVTTKKKIYLLGKEWSAASTAPLAHPRVSLGQNTDQIFPCIWMLFSSMLCTCTCTHVHDFHYQQLSFLCLFAVLEKMISKRCLLTRCCKGIPLQAQTVTLLVSTRAAWVRLEMDTRHCNGYLYCLLNNSVTKMLQTETVLNRTLMSLKY